MAVQNPPGIEKMVNYPQFPNVEEERYYRKKMLAAAYRIFGKLGFSEGVAGHITCRDPEYPDCFWVNPFGLSFKRLKMSDLVLVNEAGEIVAGKPAPLNKAAFAIHSAIHQARPDVVAAAHSHTIYGKSTAMGRLSIHLPKTLVFFKRSRTFNDYTGVVGELSEGDRIAAALEDKSRDTPNHGL